MYNLQFTIHNEQFTINDVQCTMNDLIGAKIRKKISSFVFTFSLFLFVKSQDTLLRVLHPSGHDETEMKSAKES